MTMDFSRRWPPWPLWVGSILLWTLLSLIIVSSNVIASAHLGRPVALGTLTAYVAVGTVTWAVSMPFLVWFSAQRPLAGPERWARLGQIMLVAFLWLVAAWLGTHAVRAFLADRLLGDQIAEWVRRSGWGSLVIEYWTLILYAALGQALGFWDRARQRERELARAATDRAELDAALSHAEMANLRMRVHPHFLFNSLNAVAALIRRGEEARAIEMLVGLSDLMRTVLHDGGLPCHSLGDELALLMQYLDVQRMRYGDRLRLLADIPESLHGVQVPTLLLQPLVENAVRHGAADMAGVAEIRVSAYERRGRVVVEIGNDGPHLPVGFDPDEVAGLGLALVRRRLGLWADRTGTLVLNNSARGVEAIVSLPVQLEKP